MSTWSLTTLLAGLHEDIEEKLRRARKSFGHARTKGDASEQVWLELLNTYLPKRYSAAKAHVVDSNGNFSDQIDVIILDRQYSPFIFHFQNQMIIPAESVYAVFEAKQAASAHEIDYARGKIESVRNLHRTSLPIPTANGPARAKEPVHILGGLLTFECDWNPPMGESLIKSLAQDVTLKRRLDIGCIAAHGIYSLNEQGSFDLTPERKPATSFLFELIARLQMSATVPMIDIRAYAKWLETKTIIT